MHTKFQKEKHVIVHAHPYLTTSKELEPFSIKKTKKGMVSFFTKTGTGDGNVLD